MKCKYIDGKNTKIKIEMRVELLLLGIATFLRVSSESDVTNKCYYAKICIHDGVEKCGRNNDGKLRRFLDSCDMKEYNCLKETDYVKTSASKCKSLPSLEKSRLQNEYVNKSDEVSVNENENVEDDHGHEAGEDSVANGDDMSGEGDDHNEPENESDKNIVSADGTIKLDTAITDNSDIHSGVEDETVTGKDLKESTKEDTVENADEQDDRT